MDDSSSLDRCYAVGDRRVLGPAWWYHSVLKTHHQPEKSCHERCSPVFAQMNETEYPAAPLTQRSALSWCCSARRRVWLEAFRAPEFVVSASLVYHEAEDAD